MRALIAAVATTILAVCLLWAPAAFAATITTTIPTGALADDVVAAPDGATVYVMNSGDRTISVVDTATNTVRATWPLTTLPGALALSPNGSTLFVSAFDSVLFLDTTTGTIEQAVPLAASASDITVSPDGSVVYAPLYNAGTIAVLNATTGAVVRTIDPGLREGVISLTVSPDSRTLYGSLPSSRVVFEIDAATGIAGRFASVTDTPRFLVTSTDGTALYAPTERGNATSVINTATFNVVRTIPGTRAYDVAASHDGRFVAITNRGAAGGVQIIDVTTNTVVQTVAVANAYAVAFSPSGSIYASTRSGNSVVAVSFDRSPVLIDTTPPATATVGHPYSYTFSADGTPAPTFTVSSGTLPGGLTLTAGGLLSGTPTTAGAVTFTVTATNGIAPDVTTDPLTITVEAAVAAPVFTSAAPPATAIAGQSYSYTFTATGNPAPTFAVTSGTLPAGLELDAAGVLSGIPTTASSSTFTVTATNGVAPDATTEAITITVAAAPTAPTFTAATPPASATVGQTYMYTFTATGNPAPTFAVTSGALPAGLELDAAGVLSGIPTTVSSSTFTVTATNGVAPVASTTPVTITVSPVVVPAPDRLPAPIITSPTPDQTITGSVTYSGTGTPGAYIALVTYEGEIPPQSSGPIEAAFAAADPIQVSADGTWSRIVTVTPGDYTTFAVQFLRDANGSVTGSSPASVSVTYSVTAAVVPAASTPTSPTPAVGTPNAGAPKGLAFTGSKTTGLASFGALLTAAGVALTVTTRRRRAAEPTAK